MTWNEKSLSRVCKYRKGLPQGDGLSPILYDLYVLPLLEDFQGDSSIIQFADDIAVCATSKKGMTATVEFLEQKLQSLGTKINHNKTESIAARKYKDLVTNPSAKHLGIQWLPKFNHTAQAKQIIVKTRTKLETVNTRHVDFKALKILINVVINNSLMYYWLLGVFSETHINEVRRLTAVLVRKTLFLHPYTSKKYIFDPGGLGISDPAVLCYHNFIIQQLKCLNSEHCTLKALARSNFNNPIQAHKGWVLFNRICEDLDLVVILQDNKYLLNVSGRIVDASGEKLLTKTSGKKSLDLQFLKDSITTKLWNKLACSKPTDYIGSIANANVNMNSFGFESARNLSSLTLLNRKIVYAALMGSWYNDNFFFPTRCAGCFAAHTLEHTLYSQCNLLFTEMQKEIRRTLNMQSIEVTHESNFNSNLPQISARGLSNKHHFWNQVTKVKMVSVFNILVSFLQNTHLSKRPSRTGVRRILMAPPNPQPLVPQRNNLAFL